MMFLNQYRHISAPRPLQLLFPLSRMFFCLISTGLGLSPDAGPNSHVTFSVSHSPTMLLKITIIHPYTPFLIFYLSYLSFKWHYNLLSKLGHFWEWRGALGIITLGPQLQIRTLWDNWDIMVTHLIIWYYFTYTLHIYTYEIYIYIYTIVYRYGMYIYLYVLLYFYFTHLFYVSSSRVLWEQRFLTVFFCAKSQYLEQRLEYIRHLINIYWINANCKPTQIVSGT